MTKEYKSLAQASRERLDESYYGRSKQNASYRRKAFRSKRAPAPAPKPVEEAPRSHPQSRAARMSVLKKSTNREQPMTEMGADEYGVHVDFEAELPGFSVKKVKDWFNRNPDKKQVEAAGWIFFNDKSLEAFDIKHKNKFIANSSGSWISNDVDESATGLDRPSKRIRAQDSLVGNQTPKRPMNEEPREPGTPNSPIYSEQGTRELQKLAKAIGTAAQMVVDNTGDNGYTRDLLVKILNELQEEI